jgi:hypothetical protein
MQEDGLGFIDFGQGLALNCIMAEIGDHIEMTGTLIRDGAGFALRVERGAIYHLQLHRVPVDHVEKTVRVAGTLIEPRLIEAEGVAPG